MSQVDALPSRKLSGRLLIPPFQRFRFGVSYVLSTQVSQFVALLVLRALFTSFLRPTGQNELWLAIINAAFLGAVIGAAQGMVLRPYLSSRWWIVATSGGAIATVLMSRFWNLFVYQAFNDQVPVDSPNRPLFLVMMAGLAACCYLWLGFTQFLVLRRSSTANTWWTFVPVIGVLPEALLSYLGFLTVPPHFLASLGLPDVLVTQVLASPAMFTAGILGITEAIAFCTLRQKPRPTPDASSRLTTAPEIIDADQLDALSKTLNTTLRRAWTANSAQHDLIYLLGVTEEGAIAAYQPINQAAIDQVDQTPLPSLLIPSQAEQTQDLDEKPLARFQVIFMPSGELQIQHQP